MRAFSSSRQPAPSGTRPAAARLHPPHPAGFGNRAALSLQRRCSCLGPPSAEPQQAPPLVHDVLASPGQPLEASLRRDMESRFHRDFSQVRIHTGERAARSARAVQADAYTVGRAIAFAGNQYQPHTSAGRRLLAHELAHVTQQSGSPGAALPIQPAGHPLEHEADRLAASALTGAGGPAATPAPPAVARTFAARLSNCAAGTNSAPADVATELPAIDTRAGAIAGETAAALEVTPVDATVRAALDSRFGLPPVFANGRSMNRLTGAGAPDQDTAIAREVAILARRFRLSQRLLSQPLFYRCVGPDGGSNIGGCNIQNSDCAAGSAWSCNGTGAIFLCPNFWTRFPTTDERALVAMHETFHIIFGDIHETVPPGSGGKYRNASCYESFASDLTGVPVSDTCPV